MQTYIKTEDVENFIRSLIKDSRHLKSAMKDMSIQEEDIFIRAMIKGNLEIFNLEEKIEEYKEKYCWPYQTQFINNFLHFVKCTSS